MPFTLAFLQDPMPVVIPDAGRAATRPTDIREHFGTEEAALRRAAELLPAPSWFDLRLYGPDGRRLFDQHALLQRFGHLPPAGAASPAPAEETFPLAEGAG
ncbi:hypothetical protein [Rhizosaccharibacter radicis]|uniref:Uncharacterized protein n=1 Tax=Rhizosaccharibacter radicis TaxID=2782605 RepID=A0ABT1VXW7_9PROT|nr:hypothetical protein [Acetobacteraceae bacterium KSS12]